MKKFLYNLFLFCVGSVCGQMIADMTVSTQNFGWLSYGMTFGLTPPFTLNLGVLNMTFGISVQFTVASVIFICLNLVIGNLFIVKLK